jgi:hypothetical protein
MKILYFLFILCVAVGLCSLTACQKQQEEAAPEPEKATAEISQEELTAAVPELSALHEIIYPLWHTAYPDKDYAMIKELLPQADELFEALDKAELPGILRDKMSVWDQGKANLKDTLTSLHEAADSDNQEEMLKQTEAFHSAYEVLVRTIRPLVAELDTFHQELYKLYHYYTPDYDLEKIRETVTAMQAKLPALQEAKLSSRLEDRQADFEVAVQTLAEAVAVLAEKAKSDNQEEILAAVEKVHSAYQGAEQIFN